jgi:hypothetical protein
MHEIRNSHSNAACVRAAARRGIRPRAACSAAADGRDRARRQTPQVCRPSGAAQHSLAHEARLYRNLTLLADKYGPSIGTLFLHVGTQGGARGAEPYVAGCSRPAMSLVASPALLFMAPNRKPTLSWTTNSPPAGALHDAASAAALTGCLKRPQPP